MMWWIKGQGRKYSLTIKSQVRIGDGSASLN